MIHIEIKEIKPRVFGIFQYEPHPEVLADVTFCENKEEILKVLDELLYDGRNHSPAPSNINSKKEEK